MSIIVLYALITLLFTTLLFIAGRLQARSKTAIDRLSVIAERLTEYASAKAQSMGSSAFIDEFRTTFDRINAELKQFRERSVDNVDTASSSAEAGQGCKAALELLMAKIDHLMSIRLGMSQVVAEELKTAIDASTARIEQLTAIIQRKPNPPEANSDETTSGRSATFDAKTQQDLRDLLKEFE